MKTMIEDAVDQVVTGIDRMTTSERRRYANGQHVVVRSRTYTKAGERVTWRSGVVVSAARIGSSWRYRVRVGDARNRSGYRVVGRRSLMSA